MKKQTNLLITSIFIILGLALLFLGAMTFLDPGYFRDEKVEGRNRAYIEIVTGFFFLCVGIIAYVIYVRQQTSKDLATSTPITQARITKEKVSRSPQVIKKRMEKVSETDEKKTGVKSKTKKRLLILSIIIVILVLGAVISWIIFGSSTFPITEYISDKSSKTLTYSGYGSRLDVSLSATTDDMNVRIMVDGNTVFEESNTQIVNFNHNMGFGDHAVHIFIENPAIFGFGSTIMVSGKVTISLL